MARFKATRPRFAPVASMPHTTAGKLFDTTDTSVQRALQDAESSLRGQQENAANHSVVIADLVVGRNKFNHALGRAPVFVGVCPSVADATFAYALDVIDNPVPALQVWLDVVGVAQPQCRIWMI